MFRIVFFGLDGPFASIPLAALTRAGLAPVLVVRGLKREPRPWRPQARVISARPGWLDRLTARFQDHHDPSARSEHDLTTVAQSLGIDVVETSNANRAEVIRLLARARADALVVAGFEHLLSSRVLAVPTFGGLNVHPGGLPEERGPAPLFWALRGGRTHLRWTIHMLDAGEDSGDVVAAGDLSIERGTEGLEILQQIAQAASPALVRSVRALFAGDLVRQPQAERDAQRRPRPRFEDGRIDVSKPAHAVFTFVAGCCRRYSLFVEVAQDRFFIRRAVSFDPDANMDFDFVLTGDCLLLRCNPGLVELELKEEGALFSAEY